ncbi:MAG: PRC-barrel domain-containing protein [Actinomycetota bacterium]
MHLVSDAMTSGENPIAWPALEEGTTIRSADGAELGKVIDVVADLQKDIFSGITFRSSPLESRVFVPADQIGRLTSHEVTLTITAAEAADLSPYEA